ncbi:protein kinase family protein [Actinomadura barringtoniae]|uniref:Protein kinase family protein n=1 Tax=Actinomadura barringtoniae TaxID=1427535 RepID=A0A939PJ08_9ACTN|nr:protein kinase family protein [Actinomadura barringtoniae]MBO2453540.1 protein kinase family protein [Actinomadura barringtoniae]
MSTSVIEPGTRLAGRYRLEERISDSGGSSLWKAIDEILARAVAVRTFDPEFPRVAEVVTSARAASRLTDPRLTQVFDADDSGESAYVVSEWVAGETLEQMLSKAPLEPGRAATLLFEAAEAMTTAHASGLGHLCLTPRDLVWTTGGTVKLLGIATDAVLADCYSDDPALEDVQGLGRMLYAALTAHWPGDPELSSLPAPPTSDDDKPREPRQVQAGISHALNAIACRAVGISGEPIATPAELAQALRGVPRTPLPLFAGLAATPPPAPPAAPQRPEPQAATQATPAPRRPASHRAQPQRTQQHSVPSAPTAPHTTRKPLNKGLLGVAAAALTVIVGLGAWALTSNDDHPKGKSTDANVTGGDNKPKPHPALSKLPVSTATGFEELTPQGHPDNSINKTATAVLDGKSRTEWYTETYRAPNFGNYAKGFGVLLDMGKSVKVGRVKVETPVSGAPLEVRVGSSRELSSLTAIGKRSAVIGANNFESAQGAQGQYVLVWFTTPVDTGFKARINDITVYGPQS